jgi:hypothetical protein
MFEDLQTLESNLSKVKIALRNLQDPSQLEYGLVTLLLSDAVSFLYEIEDRASLSKVSLESLTGERRWMLNKVDESNGLIVSLLIAKLRAGIAAPNFEIKTEVTTERFTLESFNGREGVLRRDFVSFLESFTTEDLIESNGLCFNVTRERVFFN